jgi:apolipoprotein N-acyltransferase
VNGRGRLAVPSAAAGVLLALSLPPWGWWPLGLAGAALLYWRLGGLGWRARLLSGWLAGLGCYAIGLAWARAFNWYGALVLVLAEALFPAAAAALTPPRRGRALGFVGAFTLAEALRLTWPFGGLPLGGVFLGQADGPLVELARLGGPLALTAGVLTGGVGLATVATALRARSRRVAGPSLAGAAVVLAGLLAGVVAGAAAPDGGAALRTLPVALVQGGGHRGVSREDVPPVTVYRAQLAATSGAAGSGADLVVWPEDVVALDQTLSGSPQAATLSRVARRLRTTLIVGVTEPGPSPTTFRNEIVVWGPSGRVVASFEKVHRVPFGEYVPDRSFFAHFASLSGVPEDAVPGMATGLVHTPVGPLGLMVSFEVFYANRSRPSVRAGAQLLVVPTNTSSYSTSQVPAQELAAARIQAVQTGRDLVQAAPTGYTAVVTQRGVVVRRSVLGRRQVVTATVALRDGMTPYDHWGDLPMLVLAAAALGAGWLRQARSRPG